MQLITKIPIPKSDHPISYVSEIMSVGSCFAVNIAQKLNYFQFENTCNPFGILFHPFAIRESIRRVAANDTFTDPDFISNNGLWHSFDMHSDLSHPDKESLIQNSNNRLASANAKILKATHLIITYGTAWVYRSKASGNLVANCHKIPQAQFEKELLSVEGIQTAIEDTIRMIGEINPDCQLIFTISPVRHIKDGFVENQRSKAHLVAALHNTLSNLPPEAGRRSSYFPSYEIVMDELRDYRFYAEDMLHPNQTAIDYIWEKFAETHISDTAFPIMREVESIQKALQHRPIHPGSESHEVFKVKLQEQIAALQHRFPRMRF